jgi:hypothetical protein
MDNWDNKRNKPVEAAARVAPTYLLLFARDSPPRGRNSFPRAAESLPKLLIANSLGIVPKAFRGFLNLSGACPGSFREYSFSVYFACGERLVYAIL